MAQRTAAIVPRRATTRYGHPSLAQKAAEWVGEDIDAELTPYDEAEDEDE